MPFFESIEKMDPKHVDLERVRKSLREELEAGTPCSSMNCPKCGVGMVRE